MEDREMEINKQEIIADIDKRLEELPTLQFVKQEIKDGRVHSAVNWTQADPLTERFWLQNLKQFWRDEEFVPSEDIRPFANLTIEQQTTFIRALGGLTLLDTMQGNVGMGSIADDYAPNEFLVRRALLQFMGAMEGIHAKSYSTIFTTLLNRREILNVFQWVDDNEFLQRKASIIHTYYKRPQSPVNNYLRKVASVFLESFLFYSGFYYPLYLAGNGSMTNSAEIIALIIRDENIHGMYTGMLAQEDYEKLTDLEKIIADAEVYQLLDVLMENEYYYTEDLYAGLGIDADVKRFLRYNANQALMNMGREALYLDVDFSSTVYNGISTDTTSFDFFSQKGNAYFLGNLVPITDWAFEYDIADEFLIGY
jgi:ribonucleoside-diphosphate reductase beta chain